MSLGGAVSVRLYVDMYYYASYATATQFPVFPLEGRPRGDRHAAAPARLVVVLHLPPRG